MMSKQPACGGGYLHHVVHLFSNLVTLFTFTSLFEFHVLLLLLDECISSAKSFPAISEEKWIMGPHIHVFLCLHSVPCRTLRLLLMDSLPLGLFKRLQYISERETVSIMLANQESNNHCWILSG